jgi:hypothetical protein
VADEQDEDREPIVRDLLPFPETPEAKARGCQCRIVRTGMARHAHALARTIRDHFGEEKPIPAIFRTLSRLPLRHIWTTNYDTLPERAWRDQRKRLDVKSRENPIAEEVDIPAVGIENLYSSSRTG